METIKNDTLVLGGKEFRSRFILGSGKFSLQLIHDVMEYGGSEIATIALRRANADSPENILDFLPEHLTLLPNTSGARNADEAVRIARLSRALGCGDFVKVEVIPDAKYLLPDNAETIRATEILAKEGFHVLPYMYPDLIAARHLVDAAVPAVVGTAIIGTQGFLVGATPSRLRTSSNSGLAMMMPMALEVSIEEPPPIAMM